MNKKILKISSLCTFAVIGLLGMNGTGKGNSYSCGDIKKICEKYSRGGAYIPPENLCSYLFSSGSPYFPGLSYTELYCAKVSKDKNRCDAIVDYARQKAIKECYGT